MTSISREIDLILSPDLPHNLGPRSQPFTVRDRFVDGALGAAVIRAPDGGGRARPARLNPVPIGWLGHA